MNANWHLALVQAIREAVPGEIICLDTEAQVELGKRAAKRTGKDIEFRVRGLGEVATDSPLCSPEH